MASRALCAKRRRMRAERIANRDWGNNFRMDLRALIEALRGRLGDPDILFIKTFSHQHPRLPEIRPTRMLRRLPPTAL